MKKKFGALYLLVFMIFTIVVCPTAKAKESPQPIVIQGAMDVETEYLIKQLQDVEKITYGGWTFWQGTIDDFPVVVAKTEVGMTNAAASTVLAIEKFHPQAIINQGTAGGHDGALHRYDIVIGEKVVNFGAFKSNFSKAKQGVHPEKWIGMEISINVNGKMEDVSDFKGDTALINTTKNVANLYKKGKVVEGVIGSADQWNRELDRIKWIQQKYSTSVEEMETASAAQVAKTYNIPFLGIRILSNSEIHNEEYDRTSGEDCQKFVLQVVKELIIMYQQ